MSFPDQRFASIATYFDAYTDVVRAALASVSHEQLENARKLIGEAIARDGNIYSCGNGGSASIANHLVCDHAKGVSTGTGLRPRVRSLVTPVEIVTAFANDVGYADVFVEQAKLFARAGDLLIIISSSGNSENVVRAAEWGSSSGIATISMTGFDGGRLARITDVALHVDCDNYGVIEDVHQSIMHVIAQFVRMQQLPESLVKRSLF